MSFQFERYNEFLNRVIEWNKVSTYGRIKNDLDSILLQRGVTLSEIKETEDAIYANDEKEIMDGVCDVFVTAGYMYVMKSGYTDAYLQPVHSLESLDVNQILDLIKYQMEFENTGPSPQSVHKLLGWASNKFSKDAVEKSLKSVLNSNDSKYIPLEEWNDSEIEYINNKYKDKGFKNIVPVNGKLNGKDVVVMRADYGKGKILKPSRFREPEIFLT